MNPAILDTDTLSALMRNDRQVQLRARDYLTVHPSLTISLITRYEILRGLDARQATAQIKAFDSLCNAMDVIVLNDEIVVHAAKIYGTLKREGRMIGDAAILIAATCLRYGYELATSNVKHFSRIAALQVCNWRD